MYKVNNKNIRTTSLIVNLEYFSHLFSGVSIADLEQVSGEGI